MKRGDVFLAKFEPRSGSEQRGTRPAILVSHDAFNQAPGWRSLIMVPISTSSKQGRRGISSVRIPRGTAGLNAESFALCHQVTTIDRQKVGKEMGELPPGLLAQVDEGLRAALGLELSDLPGSP
ncbi:MAG: type II toxin-antitoxin system PemK/MazF family toxin [Planctomycetes bacterium]|nr:type II toxin-antitoxin system PemK/MazF family toxin [Planctomycetota bacterium]